MAKANAKWWWIAGLAIVVSLASFFAIKGFTPSPSPPPPAPEAKPGDAGQKDHFSETVPIVFHVEKYREIPVSGEAFDPKVSPSGDRIVFVVKAKGNAEISVAEPSRGESSNHVRR